MMLLEMRKKIVAGDDLASFAGGATPTKGRWWIELYVMALALALSAEGIRGFLHAENICLGKRKERSVSISLVLRAAKPSSRRLSWCLGSRELLPDAHEFPVGEAVWKDTALMLSERTATELAQSVYRRIDKCLRKAIAA